ncbi:MAG: zeta toxin family protein [Firmicutes bacterium]|nr:zeta toxin family protein [Bacillota bacterium]
MKQYIIFAGANGTGKSTLYNTNAKFRGLARINMDEIVRKFGSWQNTADMSKAGKIAVKKMKEYFESGISFNQETTLCGASAIKNIKYAKEKGYRIILYYVGVDSADIAKERVRQRVLNGGHGIPEADIERRYYESLQKLEIVLPLCDIAELYDNTTAFRRIAHFQNGVFDEISDILPKWAEKVIHNY